MLVCRLPLTDDVGWVCQAQDSTGDTIGRGTHTRAVVDEQTFMDRLSKKAATAGLPGFF